MQRTKSAWASAILMGVLLLSAGPAWSAERVLLANGFSVDCHHRGTAGDGKVRLYFTENENSYLDVEQGRIQSIATVAETHAPTVLYAGSAIAAVAPGTHADINSILDTQGGLHRLNVDLLKSVVNAESGGNAHAVSRAGARGLMQLMPATAQTLGVTDSFEPGQNLRGGTSYLDQLLLRYHDDLALALAAYNAGPGAVDRYHGVPPFRETQAYVARIIREFNRRSLQAQRSAPPLKIGAP